MKPKDWRDLPDSLQEEILWDIDFLDYEPYEGSKAEVIHSIMNGSISSLNQKIVDAYWKALSEERFKSFVQNELESARRLICALEAYLEEKA